MAVKGSVMEIPLWCNIMASCPGIKYTNIILSVISGKKIASIFSISSLDETNSIKWLLVLHWSLLMLLFLEMSVFLL